MLSHPVVGVTVLYRRSQSRFQILSASEFISRGQAHDSGCLVIDIVADRAGGARFLNLMKIGQVAAKDTHSPMSSREDPAYGGIHICIARLGHAPGNLIFELACVIDGRRQRQATILEILIKIDRNICRQLWSTDQSYAVGNRN